MDVTQLGCPNGELNDEGCQGGQCQYGFADRLSSLLVKEIVFCLFGYMLERVCWRSHSNNTKNKRPPYGDPK